MTEQQKFKQYLKNKGFKISSCLATLSLVPHFYKTNAGSHALISGIGVSMFTGVNNKDGDLGCVCFFYSGTFRAKHSWYAHDAEMQKLTSVYTSAYVAIKGFENWRKEGAERIATTWTMIQ